MTQAYRYEALDSRGKLRSGVVECEGEDEAVGRIRRMGYRPVSVMLTKASFLKSGIRLPLRQRVSLVTITGFTRQLASLFKSGMPLVRSITMLSDQVADARMHAVLDQVKVDIQTGDELWSALARHPQCFNPFYVAMVRSGEQAGTLDSVLSQLAGGLEKSVKMRRSVRTALTYPVAVLGLSGTILVAMLVFLVPSFRGIYGQLHGTLPLPTRILLAMSTLLTQWAVAILPLTVLGVILLKRWLRSNTGRATWGRARLALPVVGKLYRKVLVARLCRCLELLTSSGVSILQALELSAETVQNSIVAGAILRTEVRVSGGVSLSRALAAEPVFPSMLMQMIAVGEDAGDLPAMLTRVGDFYEEEVDASLEALTSLLEPALLVFMGVTVAGMLVSLYLPMFNVIKLVS